MINVLHLGLTFSCNMSCKSCFVTKSKDVLEYEDYVHIIDELYEQGLFVLIYTYGEPLLSSIFFKIADYARQKGLVQILMTNGSLINEECAQRIKKVGVSKVFISIDNVKAELHDAYRGYRGSHSLAIRAISNCLFEGLNVGVAHTITPENVMGLFDMYDFICNLNVRSASFLRARIHGKLVQFSNAEFEFYKSFFLHCVQNRECFHSTFHDPTLRSCLVEQLKNGVISDTIYESFFSMNCCHQQNTISISPDGIVRHCNLSGKPLGTFSKNNTVSDILKLSTDCHENTICCTAISQ